MKKVTIPDIAAKTGFSKSSVSAALNHNPNTNVKTAQLIRKAALEMGCTPDPVFSELARRRWKREGSTVGENLVFLIDSETLIESRKSNPEDLKELVQYARSKGYHLEIQATDDFPSMEQADRLFYAKGVRGLMTSLRNPKDMEFLNALNPEHMAVVTHENNYSRFHSITLNWSAMLSKLLHQLSERGTRSVSLLLIENSPSRYYDEMRIGTILALQRILPITIKLHTIKRKWTADSAPKQMTPPEWKAGLQKLLKTDTPETIISWSPTSFHILKELGYKIPDDIAYASLLTRGACSGYNYQQLTLWKAQLNKLIAHIRHADFGYPEAPLLALHTPNFLDAGTF